MAGTFTIKPVHAIGPELHGFDASARDEGFRFMGRLISAWEDGSNRFDRPGEVYLGVWQGDEMAGAGGLNRDPSAADLSIGRVRHLYVSPSARRSGAGTVLMGAIVDKARETFSLLRLRTTTERGAAFYEALGFERSDAPNASHVLRL